jgi:type IV pilus biogenesis protein CpaD/CtpE
MKTILFAVFLTLLSGCANLEKIVTKAVNADVYVPYPSELTKECEGNIKIKSGKPDDIERWGIQTNTVLAECKNSHDTLVGIIKAREKLSVPTSPPEVKK